VIENRADILLQRDPADGAAAGQSLQAAIAQWQKARSYELRAASALAKLYRATNRDADARGVLMSAVEGFPPTQQFPELAEAQALLSAPSPQIDCFRRANHARGCVRLSASEPIRVNDRSRRVSPIVSGPADGLLPDHRAGAQPQRQELAFMPEGAIMP
jgi:hypothetical protein